jgi:hypothetical protein
MLSTLWHMVQTFFNEDEVCKAEARTLDFEIMKHEPIDPGYAEAVTALSDFVTKCPFLRDSPEYRGIVDEFIILRDSASTLIAV